MKMDWLSLFYDKKFQAFVSYKAAEKLSGDIALQEEAISYVLEKLSEDDWAICKKHNGTSSPEGYLRTVTNNLIIEYSRKVFGRKRPPEWLKREGLFWEQIWDELCMKRESPEFIVEKNCRNGDKDAFSVRNIISTIKAKLPWCGVSNRPESIDDENYGPEHYESTGSSIDEQQEQDRYHQILSLVQLLLAGQGNANQQPSLVALSEEILAAVRAFELPPEERLMMRMHYVDGHSHSAIARKLGVAKHIPARQNKKTLKRLLEFLMSLGFDFEDFS